ncbi:MAG: hypothetical protein IJJ90_02480 [Prevotella sp.]|nr:hypothetical protein [Prevotella sp.]
MKDFLSTIFIYILVIGALVTLMTIIFIAPSIRFCVWEMPKGTRPNTVSDIRYKEDKAQIVNCFLNNIEYYRKHSQASEYSAFYSHYSQREKDGIKGVLQPSPISAYAEYSIAVDTIVYDKLGTKCIAFLYIRTNHIDYKGWRRKRGEGKEFDACAMAGFRSSVNDSLYLYPLTSFMVFEYDSPFKAVRDLEEFYYTDSGCSSTRFTAPHGSNSHCTLGDSCFFEKSSLFRVFDSNQSKDSVSFSGQAYNCQLYYDSGVINKYRYPYIK